MMVGTYEIVSIVLSILVLWGIHMMSSPKTAVCGNQIAAIAMVLAVVLVLISNNILNLPLLWMAIAIGGGIGYFLAQKVEMIQMPQLVALLNGLGGGASVLVALIEICERYNHMTVFGRLTSLLALIIGGITLSGSFIAAGKLDRRIPQQPMILANHSTILNSILGAMILLIVSGLAVEVEYTIAISVMTVLLALGYGIIFAIRVGGADMPITISLLNSCSGLAGAICGLTIGDPLLVAVGAIVGASGIILTQIMCNAMNRSLLDILRGGIPGNNDKIDKNTKHKSKAKEHVPQTKSPKEILESSNKVIIIPGYGMAVAQAQSQLKILFDTLESQGKEVKFAIHPVAGRMPGHMNVLLAEVDIPYDKLWEMEDINPEFKETDVTIIIGACDVVNPAANTAEGTPIYGMPILKAEEAKDIIVCNLDTKPGYSGVENPLYDLTNVYLLLGDAKETLNTLL